MQLCNVSALLKSEGESWLEKMVYNLNPSQIERWDTPSEPLTAEEDVCLFS